MNSVKSQDKEFFEYKVPHHLAIIMDGNGRWAKKRNHFRGYGHLKGANIAKDTIGHCNDMGIKFLTLYAFSTENWSRPSSEIRLLMKILKRHLQRETKNLIKENIKFTYIGDISRFPQSTIEQVEKTKQQTKNCSGMTLIFALNYGGKQEICSSIKKICSDYQKGNVNLDLIDISMVKTYLDTSSFPDPDLLIRTSGEKRISNFLLWQLAYTELYFTDTLWPDFKIEDLKKAFREFTKRERRFGGVIKTGRDQQFLLSNNNTSEKEFKL